MYLFVPIYVQALGVEAFGLVGFYSTLLAVLAFADLGFTATLNRQMARLSVLPDGATRMGDLLRTYELCYFALAGLIALLLWLVAPLIALHWLKVGALGLDTVTLAIRVMGLAIACQLPSALYVGGLMGLQRQVRVNLLQVSWGLYRGCGTALVLWFIAPTITAFAWTQLLANLVYLGAARVSIWRSALGRGALALARFRVQVLRDTWHYAAGMAGMAILSICLTQLDKLVVSRALPLQMLGFYTLAGTMAAVPMMLASPIASAVFPRLTELVALGQSSALAALYQRTCAVVGVLVVPGSLALVVFAAEFLDAWTGTPAAATHSARAAALLLLGQLLQALTVVPYYVALAFGDVKLNLRIGIVSALALLPLLMVLVTRYGMAGAAGAWLLLNLGVFGPYMYFLHRRFLPGQLRRWLAHAVVAPLLAALPVLLLARLAAPQGMGRLLWFLYIGVAAATASAAALLLVPATRTLLLQRIPLFWRRT